MFPSRSMLGWAGTGCVLVATVLLAPALADATDGVPPLTASSLPGGDQVPVRTGRLNGVESSSVTLDKVTFVGKKLIPDGDLRAVTHLRDGATITDTDMSEDGAALEKLYHDRKIAVRIQPALIYLNQTSHVMLVWQINEVEGDGAVTQ